MEAYDLIHDHLLENAYGKSNAVKSRELETLFNISSEWVRKMVNSLRHDGFPICSNSKGYWYAETVEEVLETRKQLENRIIGIQNAINGLDKFLNAKKEVQSLSTVVQLSFEDLD